MLYLFFFFICIIQSINAVKCSLENVTAISSCTYHFDVVITSLNNNATKYFHCTEEEEEKFLMDRLEYHMTQLVIANFGVEALDGPLVYHSDLMIEKGNSSNISHPIWTPPKPDESDSFGTNYTYPTIFLANAPSTPVIFSPKLESTTFPPTNQPSSSPTNPPTNRPSNPPTYRPINCRTNHPTYRPTKNRSMHRQTNPSRDLSSSKDERDILESRSLGAIFIWGGSSSWTCRGCSIDNRDRICPKLFWDKDVLELYGGRCPKRWEDDMSRQLTSVMADELIGFSANASIPSTSGCLLNNSLSFYVIESRSS
jgi:hypothetical protein